MFAQFPQEPAAGQPGISGHPLAQIGNEWIDPALARLAWAIDRRLQATSDAFANSLSVDPEFAGDRRDRQSLPMKIKYHDHFPKLDHRTRSLVLGRAGSGDRFAAHPQGAP
jgi:hypothetical protein